jgi:soluble lytic murein transglycosylase-like protein
MLMAVLDIFSVRIFRHFLFIVCVCLGAGKAAAQGLRISDADVSLADPVLAEKVEAGLPVKAVKGRSVLRPGVGSRSLVKLTSYKRTADQKLLEEAILAESARYKIDPDLVFALVWQESGGRLGAVSPKNARGPMQLMPGTAVRFGVTNPHDAKQAVRGGVAYLVWLLDRYNGNVSLALASYNAGEGSVDAYLYGKTLISGGKVINRGKFRTQTGIPPYAETMNYVKRIAERYRLIRASKALKADR